MTVRQGIGIVVTIPPTLVLLAASVRCLFAQAPPTADPPWVANAGKAVDTEVQKLRQGLIVYEDADSGYNRGTFSGFFGTAIPKLSIDTGCVPAGNPPTGCSSDPNAIDKDHRTVIRFTFQPLTGNEFVGVSCVEPAGLFAGTSGSPYDLSGVNQLSFDALSPDASNGMRVQFGFGGSTAAFQTLSPQWTHITVTLGNQTAFTDLQHTAILFTIVTNAANAPRGGTVLVDNIRFDPTPTQLTQAAGFPAGYRTYGVVPVIADLPGPILIPPDQLFRNQAPVDQMAWMASVLTAVGAYNTSARALLDTFVYEEANPNLALAPPATMDQLQARGLLSCFSSGDAELKNDSGGALAGSGRPCGFSVGTKYRVVLDGATGGQNATIILALLRGYLAFNDVRYLNTALALADWIQEKLADPSTVDYGGYYYGYLYVTQVGAKVFVKSKTTVDNALIFSAFSALGDVEASAGKSDAVTWKSRAAAAGQFVKFMYRPDGRFYSGTVPDSQPTDPSQGIRADGPERGGETINSYDVIGNYTIVPLALSAQPTFLAQFNLATLMKALLKLTTTVTVGSLQLSGFSSAESDVPPNGVDWILTGSAALALRLAAGDATSTADIQTAAQQYLNQFASVEQSLAVGSLIPGATLNNEIAVRPYAQCLVSPFGCQPARPSIGATVLAIATSKPINPFALTSTAVPPVITSVVHGTTNGATISPGTDVSVFGTNLPTSASAGALVGGQSATVISASATQWTVLIPYSAAPGATTIQIGTSAQFSITLSKYAPGLLTVTTGSQTIVSATHANGSLVTASSPVTPGETIVLFATGLGTIDSNGHPSPLPTVTVGGSQAKVLAAVVTNPGTYQVNIQVDITTPAGNQPVILTIGGISSPAVPAPVAITVPLITEVDNGASFLPGVVANAYLTIKGGLLSSVTDNWDHTVINGVLPTTLDGVSVKVGGQPAYINYVSPGQINVVVPNVPAGPTTVTVTNSVGTTAAFTATASIYGPAFFQWYGSDGATYAVATRTDYSLAVKNGTFSIATAPAKPGEVIILWGTAFGPTNPPTPVGVAAPSAAPTADPVTVTVGGTPATVYTDYAVLTQGLAAVYQVAITVPANLADGDYPVVATIKGASSPTTTILTVKR